MERIKMTHKNGYSIIIGIEALTAEYIYAYVSAGFIQFDNV